MQGFAGSAVEFGGDGIEVFATVDGQIRSIREILPQ